MTRSERSSRQAQQQRASALARAQAARIAHARFKAAVRNDTRDWTDAFTDPALATMRIADVLDALPLVGDVKLKRALRVCAIGESRRVSALTDHQRAELIAFVDHHYRYRRHPRND